MSRLTLRVLVKGASTVNWASGIDESREAFTFPRAIEAQLVADGWPAEVRAITLPSELTSKILLNWQQEVLGFSPDVVVLVYGHYETVHFVLPKAMLSVPSGITGNTLGPPIFGFSSPPTESARSRTASASTRKRGPRASRRLNGSVSASAGVIFEDCR